MNVEDRDACYEIFRSKDARYDGRFFIGITTTGIYCRPVCTARLPKPENCRYFRTAAEAEKAGFRPCLLCRPELAPGASRVDASSELAARALYYLRDSCGEGRSLAELSGALGCSERHLRRVFKEEYHVTPVEYLQTCRLLLAKQLLAETSLTVLDVAMTAGFGSVRRMNELFMSRYRMTPLSVRRMTGKTDRADTVTVSLGFRTPYAWEELLAYLKPRAIPHIERVDGLFYERVLRITARNGTVCCGTVRVTADEKSRSMKAMMSDSLVPVMPQVLSKVRQMFDLDCDPVVIEEKLQSMEELLPRGRVPGIRVPGCFDAFETACRAIIGQQITVRAASTICGRIAEVYGSPAETSTAGLDRTFPDERTVAGMGDDITEKLGKLGVTAVRSRAIRSLAEALQGDDGIRLDRAADPETEIARLREIRGIGSWTANYIAMRTMGWTDAFLEDDAEIRRALPDRNDRERRQLSEAWKPWRSYAMMNLWNRCKMKTPDG